MILKTITLNKEYIFSENEFSIQENVKFRNLIIKKALVINNNYIVDFETDKYIIEIKSSHGWYKEDLESGKIGAKNKAAQEYAASINKEFLFLLNVKDYSFLT